jgi:hypothetical protein
LLADILIYSYLLLPLCILIKKDLIKERDFIVFSIYGLVIFGLLFFHGDIPKPLKKYYQTLYTVFEYLVFTYMLWTNITNRLFKYFIIAFSILFILFECYYVTNSSHQRLDSVPIGIETILIFIYVFFFFFDFSKNIKGTFIYNHYCFWLSIGILIYLGGSFFYYILVNNLDNEEDVVRFGNLTYVAEIIKNLLFAFSIYLYKKYPANNSHNHTKNIPNLDMI